jgi:hypothetical protein
MTTYGGEEAQLDYSWPRHEMDENSMLHAQAALPPGKQTRGTQWIGGWVGLWACLDSVEKRKFIVHVGNRTQVTHPADHCYTDWAIPASVKFCVQVQI